MGPQLRRVSLYLLANSVANGLVEAGKTEDVWKSFDSIRHLSVFGSEPPGLKNKPPRKSRVTRWNDRAASMWTGPKPTPSPTRSRITRVHRLSRHSKRNGGHGFNKLDVMAPLGVQARRESIVDF